MMNNDTHKIATLRFATGLPAGGGAIGTAAATVDVASSFVVLQALAMTATATLPPPTDAQAGDRATVGNDSSSLQNVLIHGTLLQPGKYAEFVWSGTVWLVVPGGPVPFDASPAPYATAATDFVPGAPTNPFSGSANSYTKKLRTWTPEANGDLSVLLSDATANPGGLNIYYEFYVVRTDANVTPVSGTIPSDGVGYANSIVTSIPMGLAVGAWNSEVFLAGGYSTVTSAIAGVQYDIWLVVYPGPYPYGPSLGITIPILPIYQALGSLGGIHPIPGPGQELVLCSDGISRPAWSIEGTVGSGLISHAEGYLTHAGGRSSHAEGEITYAGGRSSHAEGETTVALGRGSHSEGVNTFASGQRSHAEGEGTTAEGRGSHSEGAGTHAYREYEHAQGSFVFSGGLPGQESFLTIGVDAGGVAPAVLVENLGPLGGLRLRNNCVSAVSGVVTGRNAGSAVVGMWRYEAVVSAVAGVYRLVGASVVTLIARDAGAATWTVTVAADAAVGLAISVTSSVGDNTRWLASARILEARL